MENCKAVIDNSSVPEDLLEQADNQATALILKASDQASALIEKANSLAIILLDKADLKANNLIDRARKVELSLLDRASIGEKILLAYASNHEKELIQKANAVVRDLMIRAKSLDQNLTDKAIEQAMGLIAEASIVNQSNEVLLAEDSQSLITEAEKHAQELIIDADEQAKALLHDADLEAKDLVKNANSHAKDLLLVADERAKVLVKESCVRAKNLLIEAAVDAKSLLSEAALQTKDLISEAALQSKGLIGEAALNYVKSKITFMNIAGHELRTPITSLSLGVQLAERDFEKGLPFNGQLLKKIRRPLNRLVRLLSYILDMSLLERKILAVEPVKADLIALINDTLEEFRFENPNFLFNFKEPLQKIELTLDPLRIYQVLANLFDNAVKHSGARSLDAALVLKHDVARVEISDKGIGVSQEDQNHLFSTFHKGHSGGSTKSSGLGLGLFISKEIMKLHHGNIGYEDRKGGGSVFFFELPLGV